MATDKCIECYPTYIAAIQASYNVTDLTVAMEKADKLATSAKARIKKARDDDHAAQDDLEASCAIKHAVSEAFTKIHEKRLSNLVLLMMTIIPRVAQVPLAVDQMLQAYDAVTKFVHPASEPAPRMKIVTPNMTLLKGALATAEMCSKHDLKNPASQDSAVEMMTLVFIEFITIFDQAAVPQAQETK